MSKIVTLWLPEFLTAKKISKTLDAESDPTLDSEQSFASLLLPSMSKLLSKADVFLNPLLSFHEEAVVLCHQKKPFPVATITANIDLEAYDPHVFWLRIDPVQLVPDRDTLVLLPPSALQIKTDEAEALIAAFNAHFAEDKVEIEMGTSNRWYLRIVQPVDIQTTPIAKAAWQSVDLHLPTGNAANYWKKLINETQMLFFSHPVNELRRETGLPEINSVWIWGEGQLSQGQIERLGKADHADWTIYSENVYLQGLAKCMGANPQKNLTNYQNWLKSSPSNRSLIMPSHLIDKNNDLSLEDWLIVVQWLEDEWFKPLELALKNKEISSLLIDLGSGKRFHLTPGHLNKFWRFNKPVQKRIL